MFCSFSFLFCSFPFFFFFLFCDFFSTVRVQATFQWKGGSPTVGRTRLSSGAPLAVESPVPGGALALLAICLRKSVPPQEGVPENRQGSGELSPFRLAASTVRGSGSPPSLFPGGHSPVPYQSTSGFPLWEKTPRPMGLQLAKTRSLKGGVRAVLEAVEKPIIASQVINLDIEIHVGSSNDVRKV